MMEMSQEELIDAINNLGDGNHKMKDIENQVEKDRHMKKKESKNKRKKCKKSTTK